MRRGFPDEIMARLDQITKELVDLYRQRPTQIRGYHAQRAEVVLSELTKGSSVTAAKEAADRATISTRYMCDDLESQILALQEERDHLRLCLDHLG